jgi:hypothetical protein
MIQGDTIRLQVQFKTFTGDLVDPEGISLTIYDNARNVLETIPITNENKESIGKYTYDYTPPLELDEFIFEFKGVYNNKPIVARDKVEIKFV